MGPDTARWGTQKGTHWWKLEKPAWSTSILKRKRIKLIPTFLGARLLRRDNEKANFIHINLFAYFLWQKPGAAVVERLQCVQMITVLTAPQGVCCKHSILSDKYSSLLSLFPLPGLQSPTVLLQSKTHLILSLPPAAAPLGKSQGQHPRNSSVWHICASLSGWSDFMWRFCTGFVKDSEKEQMLKKWSVVKSHTAWS